ncbi:MAG TPA: peptide ABC transporter substrate-binding protein [Chloroflexota bacterium]|nr:peptide ABC transporter substrate-binding protein [Chloroflexota bacterium]
MKRIPRIVSNAGIATMVSTVLLVGANASFPTRSAAASRPLPTLNWPGLVGDASWVASLDPADINDGVSGGVVQMVQANLVKVLPNGQPIPDLATWKISHNRRIYWFTIRKNARFSNGDPVTAQDVVYSLTRALLPSTHGPIAMAQLGNIAGAAAVNTGKTKHLRGIKILSRRKVQVTLTAPAAYWPALMSYNTGDILDQRIVAGHKAGVYLTNTCSANVGAGPFMFVCRNTSSNRSSFYPIGATPTITMVPNPYFYGRKPAYRVVMHAIANPDTSYLVFQSGQLDATTIPPLHVAQNRHRPGFKEVPTGTLDWLAPDLHTAPFNNLHCRLAIAYAINQNAINNQIERHTQITIHTILPKGIPGWYPGRNNPQYNPVKARQQLSQCPGGLHNVPLVYYKASTASDNQFSAIQNMLAAIGITVTLRGLSLNDWLNVVDQPLKKTHTPIAESTWGAAFADGEQFFDFLLVPGLPTNISGYNNPTVTRLIHQADVAASAARRRAIFIRASHIVVSQGVMIPIDQPLSFSLVKPWVHGLVPSVYLGSAGVAPRGGEWANVTVSRH